MSYCWSVTAACSINPSVIKKQIKEKKSLNWAPPTEDEKQYENTKTFILLLIWSHVCDLSFKTALSGVGLHTCTVGQVDMLQQTTLLW